MQPRAPRRTTWVLRGLTAGILLWAAGLTLRLFQIQHARPADEDRRIPGQQRRTIELPAPRGKIVDRNGRLLAVSVVRESVSVDPRHVPNPEQAARIFSEVLGLDYAAWRDKLADLKRRRAGFVYVKRRISPEESQRLRQLRRRWIHFRPELVRQYPKGSLAAHVIGAVDFDQRGALGVESALEAEIGGQHGRIEVVADVWGRAVQPLSLEPPQPGASIGLSVDERIQYAAERELEAAARAEGCSSASLVVMDPHTGDILALASYPGFDPNQPPRDAREGWVRFHNHAFSVPFEPGSVFKVVTLAAAFETTSLKPETIVPCGNGRIALYGRVVRDHHAYSALTAADVLAKSSNIGAIHIAYRVGESRMHEYVRRFGFGQKTGVPLPAESAGRVRPLRQWHKTSLASIAMGHELSATTLQLARAVSVIANGGLLVKPRLVLWRQQADGRLVKTAVEPPQRVLRPETAFLMRRLMEGVVLHGTGKAARLEGYSAAGKTGTAQIFDRQLGRFTHVYNASFVGFAPVTAPAIVVAVTLNGTRRYGGEVAAPVFRRVASEALRILNVPRDLPESGPEAPPETDLNDVALTEFGQPVEDAGQPETPAGAAGPAPAALLTGLLAPDFKGMPLPAVLARAMALGVAVEPVGSGIAREQDPAPGALLPPGARLRVIFRP
ncbi:MAG: penicillin-binding protein [Bryobacterales bacterium]|nr:penicillin-binding protein [Bryobacterales bacterium]